MVQGHGLSDAPGCPTKTLNFIIDLDSISTRGYEENTEPTTWSANTLFWKEITSSHANAHPIATLEHSLSYILQVISHDVKSMVGHWRTA